MLFIKHRGVAAKFSTRVVFRKLLKPCSKSYSTKKKNSYAFLTMRESCYFKSFARVQWTMSMKAVANQLCSYSTPV